MFDSSPADFLLEQKKKPQVSVATEQKRPNPKLGSLWVCFNCKQYWSYIKALLFNPKDGGAARLQIHLSPSIRGTKNMILLLFKSVHFCFKSNFFSVVMGSAVSPHFHMFEALTPEELRMWLHSRNRAFNEVISVKMESLGWVLIQYDKKIIETQRQYSPQDTHLIAQREDGHGIAKGRATSEEINPTHTSS